MTVQSHKEERFLFVIYPFIALSASVLSFSLPLFKFSIQLCIESVVEIINNVSKVIRLPSIGKFFKLGLLSLFIILSCSRIASLYDSFHAPMELYTKLNTVVFPNGASSSTNVFFSYILFFFEFLI